VILKVIEDKIDFCKKYSKIDLAILLQIEKNKLVNSLKIIRKVLIFNN